MMQIYRAKFGGHDCEIVVGLCHSSPSQVVAWALELRAGGKHEPLYDERGTIVREYADTHANAVASMRRRLLVLLGEERS